MAGEARRNRVIREHFRSTRRSLGLTQAGLAKQSNPSATTFDRQFVAGLENNGLPATVRKFFSYAHHAKIDLKLISDLTVLESVAPKIPGPVDYAAARQQFVPLAESGQFAEALGWAFAALDQVELEGPASDRAKLLLAIAIIATNSGHFSVARYFAEDAIRSQPIEPVTEARVLVQLHEIYRALELDSLAVSILANVREQAMEEDPFLRFSVTFRRAYTLCQIQRSEDSLRELEQLAPRIESYVKDPKFAKQPVWFYVHRARALAKLGRFVDAERDLKRGVEIHKQLPHHDKSLELELLITAGEIEFEKGNFPRATNILLSALEISESRPVLSRFAVLIQFINAARRAGFERAALKHAKAAESLAAHLGVSGRLRHTFEEAVAGLK